MYLPYTRPISSPYYHLLPSLFKRFSIASAVRTAVPTLGYYLRRPAIAAGSKPALFSMNILPPMMTVWHHCVRKYLGDAVDVTVFDCSGRLDASALQGFRVQKFLNLYASTKCDEFIRSIARNRTIAWLCDDDIFFISDRSLPILEREFQDPNTASVSFRPRGWWEFDLNGKKMEASGSYCVAINREIFWKKEHLSLAPADHNPHTTLSGSIRRYDTFDKANEILLIKGYRCPVIPKQERDACITGFSGISGAVMMLWHFRKPEDILDYYRGPDKKAWEGNVLPGTLCALLAICTIQECYEKITGKKYPLPSLPSRAELEKVLKEKRLYMRSDVQIFEEMKEASAKLKDAL